MVLIFCGCTNYHNKYYRDLTNGIDFRKNPNIEISNAPPKLITTNNHDETARKLREDGYSAVGYSSFWTSRDFSEPEAIEYAEQIKASVILFSKKYRNSQSESTPLILPNTQTSYNSFIGTTTTYGTQTTYIPTTSHYYDYMISYWIKQKSFRLGIEVKDLSDADKIALGSNKGAVVDIVTKNTTAYEADIINGDLIRKISDDAVLDKDSFYKLLDKHEGNTVKITLIRNGQEISKDVRINKTVK